MWLDRLADVVERDAVDVLLVAGDVFDGINPSGESLRLFYSALRDFKRRRPTLTTIITSGNHDPAARLEAPAAVLESLDVHVVATVRRRAGSIDHAAHMIALDDASCVTQAFVCAIPFLRAADLPGLTFAAEAQQGGSPIVAAARRFHFDVGTAAEAIAAGVPVVAMGHLHCHGATESLGAERRILIGGEHALPEDVFPETFAYVALGHLHGQQNLSGSRIRYSGSCFPLSATEVGYNHGVTLIDVDGARLTRTHRPIERPVPVVKFPRSGAITLDALAAELDAMDLDPEQPRSLQPFVYVELLPAGPATELRAKAEKLVAEHAVRLVEIRIQRAEQPAGVTSRMVATLTETDPDTLFLQAFRNSQNSEAEPRHVAAFREAASEV